VKRAGRYHRIPRPVVPVTPADRFTREASASCTHCRWDYSAWPAGKVRQAAAEHRDDHREGRIPASAGMR